MRDIAWNECSATFRRTDEETGATLWTLDCTLDAHADPMDGTAQHRDVTGVWWSVKWGEIDD